MQLLIRTEVDDKNTNSKADINNGQSLCNDT